MAAAVGIEGRLDLSSDWCLTGERPNNKEVFSHMRLWLSFPGYVPLGAGNYSPIVVKALCQASRTVQVSSNAYGLRMLACIMYIQD